jgi:hypothetical protein
MWLKRLLTPPLIVLAALLMWIEEWLWEHLKTFTGWVAKFPLIRWFERFVERLPPYPTMALFLLPGAVLLPVKIGAVWLMTHGHWLWGMGLIVGAKVLGTAIAARAYVVCKPKLMTIGWFARLHDWLIATRDWLYSRMAAMPLYQLTRAKLAAMKQSIRRVLRHLRGRRGLGARWRAIRRWQKRNRTRRSTAE